MATPDPAPWKIMTSLRWDPQLLKTSDKSSACYMLLFHRDRMLAAAEDFDWEEPKRTLEGYTGLAHLASVVDNYMALGTATDNMTESRSYKVRILLSQDGQLAISASEVPVVTMEDLLPTTFSVRGSNGMNLDVKWQVHVSPTRTVPSLHTKHKTTHRRVYDEIRACIPRVDASSGTGMTTEVLLVNTDNEIMEGSITTPYFFRNGRWVTPPATAGGNMGTTRRWALRNGLCIEQTIGTSEVQVGEVVILSNSVRGFGLGTLASILI